MSYAITGGESYNMVLTHPQSSIEFHELCSSELSAEMRTHYQDWDPRLVTIYNTATMANNLGREV